MCGAECVDAGFEVFVFCIKQHVSIRSIVSSSSPLLPSPHSLPKRNSPTLQKKKKRKDKHTLRQLRNLILCNLTKPVAGRLDARVKALGDLGACAGKVDASQARLKLGQPFVCLWGVWVCGAGWSCG